MKAQNGFTLVELMVVISIMAILSSLTFWGFSSWHTKNGLEAAAKDIYSLLVQARNDASNTNTAHQINFSSTQAQRVAVDLNGDADTTDEGEAAITFDYSNTSYTISGATNVTFDRRGLANVDNQTIRINTSVSGISPAVDCIVVHFTRINMGKWEGGNCVPQ